MKFRWTLAPPQPLLAEQLASTLKVSSLLTQCLLNRGLSEPAAIENFLSPRLKNLADPFLLPNMEAAVARLFAAHERDEPLVIFGDYDVDGVSSTALLVEVFRRLGWRVNYYLPHRMDEGYGLSRDGVENCLKKFPTTLLLAVDCGSTAVESIAWLRERGVDTIVLDHHQVSNPAPAAVALVNPQLAASGGGQGTGDKKMTRDEGQVTGNHVICHPSPVTCFTELCSAGLAFKLAHALVKRGREAGLPGAGDFDLRPLLDLVALGTIADVVPLTGENRVFVSAGLEKLAGTTRPGLVALKKIAQTPERPGVSDVGYQLAPRLNAAGRLENAEEALHLLLAENEAEAVPLAQNLDAQNRERQKIERGITEQVIGVVRSKFDAQKHFVIVEGGLLWHIGVVGIVASRVLQQFYRPTIIIGGEGGGNWRGSGRSIAGFDLAAALRECDGLLVRHGGHAMAAGLTIQPDKLDAFRARLNDLARLALKPEDLQPPLRLDAEVELREISLESLAELARLKPNGQANPPVQFFARNLAHARPLQRVGAEKQHVKLWVTDGVITFEAVWWNAGGGSLPVGKFDLAFTPGANDFNGRTTVQLKVLDWREAE
jgi:single-stranded-DNA-specific exonuclease